MDLEEYDSLTAILLLAHSEGDVDDEKLLVLLMAAEEDRQLSQHRVLGPRIFLESLDEETCELRFRSSNAEIRELNHTQKFVGPSRTAWTGLEGLMVVLRRLAYPCRLCELSDEFGRSSPDLSRIFNTTLMWIWRNWGGAFLRTLSPSRTSLQHS
eukprot:scpid59864/ scgid29845/ 